MCSKVFWSLPSRMKKKHTKRQRGAGVILIAFLHIFCHTVRISLFHTAYLGNDSNQLREIGNFDIDFTTAE